jgi:peptidoglycan/LPS O-acetylase OafA/YrhL
VLVRVLMSIISLGILMLISHQMIIYFLFWLCGTALVILPGIRVKNSLLKKLLLVFSMILAVISLVVSRGSAAGEGAQNFMQTMIAYGFIAVSFTLHIYLLIHSANGSIIKDKNIFSNISRELAGFSYTLYLIHLPILIFIRSWFGYLGIGKWQLTIGHILGGFVIIVLVIMFAYLISRVTEAKTAKIRNLILGVTLRKINLNKVDAID